MTRRARRWIWIAAGGVLVAQVGWVGFVSLFSGRMVKTAYEEKLPPGYVYAGTEVTPVHVEKAFFASAYGGWQGDGEEMTAYKIRSTDVAALLAGLKTKHPDYRWEEYPALHSDVSYLAKQLPPEFRPVETARLLHGVAPDGASHLEYYFDRQLEVLFAVSTRS